jgi:uncharacterized RDD family membrane protein YckC
MLGFQYLIIAVIVIAYFSVFHGWKGRTIGKMAGKLKVVNLDGSTISWQKATARGVAYYGIMLLSAFAYLVGSMPAVGIAGLIGGVWVLADFIFALVDTRTQRALHDRICGTRVIWEG